MTKILKTGTRIEINNFYGSKTNINKGLCGYFMG